MRSVAEIVATARSRTAEMGARLAKMREIRDVAGGEIVYPLPELEAHETAGIANTLLTGLDGTAQRAASTMPDLRYPSLRPGMKGHDDDARRRRQANLGWWEASGMQPLVLPQCFRYYFGYASAPVLVRPSMGTGTEPPGVPIWHALDPLAVLPAPLGRPGELVPPDAIVVVRRTLAWLRLNYPERAAQVTEWVRRGRRNNLALGEESFEILWYIDDSELVTIAYGHGGPAGGGGAHADDGPGNTITHLGPSGGDTGAWGIELERESNRAGRPLVVVPGRITIGGPVGQFDALPGMAMKQARLDALEYTAIREGVFPKLWLVSNGPGRAKVITVADGAKGILGEVEGGTIVNVNAQPSYLAHQAIDRLERSQRVEGGVPPQMCVDAETEILTADGWKRYDQIDVGTSVLTLNHDTGFSEWQPVEKVNIYPVHEQVMIHAEGLQHSSLTTLNHRWPVLNGKRDRVWQESAELTVDDSVPFAAMCADLPTEPKWSDALVETVAWFYTEGHRERSRATITQSLKNERNVERIRACLAKMFGPPATQPWRRLSGAGQGNVGHDGVPRWRETTPNSRGVVVFKLSCDAARVLDEYAPNKVPTFDFLRSLTFAQLSLFIDVSMLADNCGPTRFGQKDRARSEAFGFAVVLSGQGVSYRHRVKMESRPGWRAGEYEAFIVRLRSRRVVAPKRNAVKGSAVFREVTYDGLVWCPTTPNGTWYARRKGSVYFTGNSGENPTNVRTGRASDSVLSASIDFGIAEAQRVVAAALEIQNSIAQSVSKGWFGPRKLSFDVGWKGAAGRIDYTPAELFAESYPNRVRYSLAGADLNSQNIRHSQSLGVGKISLQTARELDPEIEDPVREKERRLVEDLEGALMADLLAPGVVPPPIKARIVELVARGGGSLWDAFNTAQREAQERQATSGEPGTPTGPAAPGSPETMSGMSPPGLGVEASTIEPPAAGLANLDSLLGALSPPRNPLQPAGV